VVSVLSIESLGVKPAAGTQRCGTMRVSVLSIESLGVKLIGNAEAVDGSARFSTLHRVVGGETVHPLLRVRQIQSFSTLHRVVGGETSHPGRGARHRFVSVLSIESLGVKHMMPTYHMHAYGVSVLSIESLGVKPHAPRRPPCRVARFSTLYRVVGGET